MFNIVEHLKANPKKAERIIAILDEKEQAAEAKIDEIDQVLQTLPEDDPYAKSLRVLKAQNQQLLKQTQDLQVKLGDFEKKTQSIEQKEAVKQAETLLTKALDDVAKTLQFDDEEDKSDWRRAILTYLVNNPKEYATEGDFLNTIQELAKNEHQNIIKRNERIMGRYIKAKAGAGAIPTHPAGAGAKPLSKVPKYESLQDDIEEALKNEAMQNKD